MSEQFYPLVSAGLGLLVGAAVALLALWIARKRKPHWFTKKEMGDTALTVTLIGMAFALLAFPLGATYFLLYLFYGITAIALGFGITHALKERKARAR